MKNTSSNKTIYHFPVIIEKDKNGYYLGKVPALRSCYTQAKTLPELYKRLKEVVSLCIAVEEKHFSKKIEQNEFIGIQQLEFAK
jgi:predicted RNase H-like HicB family nuclease